MKIASNYFYTILAYTLLHILTAVSVILSLVLYVLRREKAMNRVIHFWARGSFIMIGNDFMLKAQRTSAKGKNTF